VGTSTAHETAGPYHRNVSSTGEASRRQHPGGRTSPAPPIRAALGNRQLRRVLFAGATASIAEWALWVGVLVYAHDLGGAAAAGSVSLALLVPAMIVTPVAGSAADGLRPNHVLVAAFAAQAIALLAAATAAATTGSLLAVVVPVAVATTAITFIHPAVAVVLPGLVASPAELTAGNLLAGYCDSSAVLLGPLLAAGILVITGPAAVLWTCAALTGLSTLATLSLLRADAAEIDLHDSAEGARPARSRRRTSLLREGIATIARRPELRALLVVLAAQHLLIGGLDLIYIVFAVDELHLSASAPGLFGASFGLGAIAGGIASTALVSRAPLARWTIGAMAVIIAALAALAGAPALVTALCLFPVMGISRSALDLSGRILLQRAAPQDALATTFAVLEAMSLIFSALGVVVVRVLIGLSGARAALAATGCVLAIVLACTARSLRRVDDVADAPVVAIRLLRRIPLFAALPAPALEGVARAGRPFHVPADTTIISEGEAGDRYYAIARGDIDVTIGGHLTRTMHGGEGFGEIALLADRPRTATVRATSAADLLAIERGAFLTVVLGHDASTRAAWGTARRFEPHLAEPVG